MGTDTRKYQFKVLFDPGNKKLEGVPIKDNYGNQIGSAIVVADANGKLPTHSNPKLVECEAELIVRTPQKRLPGERTFLKHKSRGARKKWKS